MTPDEFFAEVGTKPEAEPESNDEDLVFIALAALGLYFANRKPEPPPPAEPTVLTDELAKARLRRRERLKYLRDNDPG